MNHIHSLIYSVQAYTQQTQNICITFVQRRPNVFDAGPTLFKWIQMFYVSWVGRMYVRVFCILAASHGIRACVYGQPLTAPHGIGAYLYGQPLVSEASATA